MRKAPTCLCPQSQGTKSSRRKLRSRSRGGEVPGVLPLLSVCTPPPLQAEPCLSPLEAYPQVQLSQYVRIWAARRSDPRKDWRQRPDTPLGQLS